ncbi:MAG: DUF2283 domain-containing protein [Candidatus Woesebacteria bacterium]|nr:DUF2283 domain-containing protein [Candidatus Woesebacteria bacterium]
MKVRYDKKVNALYISLAKGKYSDSVKISDTVLVDKDKNGKILGIEVLEATKNIPAFDPQKVDFKVQAV